MSSIGLRFEREETVSGNTFYYFRAGLLPDDWLASLLYNLLILASDRTDLGLLTTIPAIFPDVIEENTSIPEIDGTSFVAPSDLYRLAVLDFPAADTLTPDIDALFATAPVAVYVDLGEISPSLDVPDDIDPEVFEPNEETLPNWHFPTEGYGLYDWWVAWFSGNNKADLGMWELYYNACEIPAGHIGENLDQFEFISLNDDYGQMLFEAPSGAGYRRDSCLYGEQVGAWLATQEFGVSLLRGYMPATTDPAIWWVDELLGIEPPEFDVPGAFLTIAAALTLIFGFLETMGTLKSFKGKKPVLRAKDWDAFGMDYDSEYGIAFDSEYGMLMEEAA